MTNPVEFQGRYEDAGFLRGEGCYTADIAVEGMATVVFVRSPFAHAEITRIDVSAALACPGVLGVLTGADAAADGLGTISSLLRRRRSGGAEMFVPPHLPLSGPRARFVGDAVALVVAETPEAAQDAAETVEIEWEELPQVADLAEALAPEAPRIWPELPDNECFCWQEGDADATEAALAEAAHLVKLKLRVPRASANPIEPRACLALYDPESGNYTIYAPVQSPWQTRKLLTNHALHIEEARLRVICKDVGGSFGMKGQTYPEYAACLWAARRLGRPVRWVAERNESLLSDDHGRDVILSGTLGLDGEGRMLALKVEGLMAVGAYVSVRGTLPVQNISGITGVYRIPQTHATIRGVHTNTSSISPYRGAGRPEAALFIERLVEVAAAQLGLDSVELRLRNMIRSDELPWTTPLGFTYDSGDYAGNLKQALQLSDTEGWAARKADSESRGLLRGRGIANVVARSMASMNESARIIIGSDERVRLECGAVSHGQGHATVFRALLAERLGIDPERIDYLTGDTGTVIAGVGTFGSRTAGLAGMAITGAAAKLVSEARRRAAARLDASEDTLAFENGGFTAPGGVRLSLWELAAETPLEAAETYAPEAATFPCGCHVAEVEVDPETGTVQIDRYAVVEDVGTPLNHMIVEGQLHGGIAQGAGQALLEELVYESSSGQVLTGSFMDYAMPRADDFPSFAVGENPHPSPTNPLGVKGGGEGGTVGGLPVVVNAIADALSCCGITDIPIPATPQRIWRLLRTAQQAA